MITGSSMDGLCLCVTYFGLWLHLQALICLIDKKTGEKGQKRPRFVKQDQVCIARLRTAGTICLETFKEFPQMGRFTLRDEGKKFKRSGEVSLGDHF